MQASDDCPTMEEAVERYRNHQEMNTRFNIADLFFDIYLLLGMRPPPCDRPLRVWLLVMILFKAANIVITTRRAKYDPIPETFLSAIAEETRDKDIQEGARNVSTKSNKRKSSKRSKFEAKNLAEKPASRPADVWKDIFRLSPADFLKGDLISVIMSKMVVAGGVAKRIIPSVSGFERQRKNSSNSVYDVLFYVFNALYIASYATGLGLALTSNTCRQDSPILYYFVIASTFFNNWMSICSLAIACIVLCVLVILFIPVLLFVTFQWFGFSFSRQKTRAD